jgi:uncharacterized membrane protein
MVISIKERLFLISRIPYVDTPNSSSSCRSSHPIYTIQCHFIFFFFFLNVVFDIIILWKRTMCWNITVTGIFSFVQITTAIYLYRRQRTVRDTAYAVSIGIFASMELLQFLTWFVIEPYDKYLREDFTCNPVNKFLTFLSVVNIFLQPVSFALGAYLSNQKKGKTLFRIPLAMAIILFLAMCASVIIGEFFDFPETTNDIYSLDGDKACSYDGPHGHILWKFPFAHHTLLPNYFPYMLSTIVFLYMHPLRICIFSMFGFWGLSSFSFWYLDGSPEFAAFWCWITIINCGFPLVEPYVWDVDTEKAEYEKYTKKKALKMKKKEE